jgi:hypothetical protein
MNYNIIDFISTVSSMMVDGFLSTIGKRWLRRSESQTQPLAMGGINTAIQGSTK